jgi:hypothetical protein
VRITELDVELLSQLTVDSFDNLTDGIESPADFSRELAFLVTLRQ